MANWTDCVGPASTWLATTLEQQLHYAGPLPVQAAVVPVVTRALLSGVPLDVSLTAPTGSGKTLCYLIPMLRLIAEAKRGVDDTRLRALVLVPTKALGQQVHRELQRLVRHTTISAFSLCGDAASVREEAHALVRSVQLGGRPASRGNVDARVSGEGETLYFSRVDIIVTTPQRLLRHLDSTPGLRLVALQFLVIDEADQVLAGNFANFVAKVVDRFDAEVTAQCRDEAEWLMHGQTSAKGSTAGDAAASTCVAAPASGARAAAGRVLHKMLCSATLSSRIARISEVRLRNCRYFTLDSHGTEMASEGGTAASLVKATFALPPSLQEHIVFVEDHYRHAVLLKLVRGLLQSIAARMQRRRDAQQASGHHGGNNDDDDDGENSSDEERHHSGDGAGRQGGEDASEKTGATPRAYPDTSDDVGSRILVFCSSADEARVMGHFLYAAGVREVIEFTTTATESERRRALLRRHDGGSCIVASDALMRGIDIPDVGHVVMYHPPGSVAQYVHRAGRTARAMRPGHVHLLLSKLGPSGGQADGEVAKYKELSTAVTRTQAVRYERHFFRFARAPTDAARATAATTGVTASVKDGSTADTETAGAGEEKMCGNGATAATPGVTPQDAEWWIAEADRCLAKSQRHLQSLWASAMTLARGADAIAANDRRHAREDARPPVAAAQRYKKVRKEVPSSDST